jgi:hypothetical protein
MLDPQSVQALLDVFKHIKYRSSLALHVEQDAVALLAMYVNNPAQIVGLDRYTELILHAG